MLVFATGCPKITPTGCTTAADCPDDGNACTDATCDGGVCGVANNTASCDDGNPCTDGDVCADGSCTAGTTMVAGCCNTDADCMTGEVCGADNTCSAVCTTDAECDDSDACTDDACVSGACQHTNNTADCDDGNACTEMDVCADGTCAGTPTATSMACDDGLFCNGVEACDPATGDCAAGADPCPADQTCNEDTDMCEAATAGPMVSISGCPTAAVNQNDTAMLMATTTGFAAGGSLSFSWTAVGASFDPADAADTTATLSGSGMVDLTVTVTSTVNDASGSPETATDTCTVDVTFTPLLVVEAGNLIPDRAVPSGIYSGGVPPGCTNATNNCNMLTGTVTQASFTSSVFATTWSLVSQPTGSGQVTILTPNALQTGFQVSAPALAGVYQFEFKAVNTQTSESMSDTVNLQLIDTPSVALTPDAQSRYFVEPGVSVDIPIRYTSTADVTVNLWAHSVANGLPGQANATNQVLLGSRNLSAGTAVDTTVTADTSKLSAGAATLNIGANMVDVAGNTALANLADAGTNAYIVIGNSIVASPVNGAITGTAGTTAAEPPFVDLATEVGEPQAVTNAQGVQSFTADQVIHPGVGEGATAAFAHPGGSSAQRRILDGVDFNRDGFDDLAVVTTNTAAGAATLSIMFGQNALPTNAGAATAGASNAGDWDAVVATFTANVGTSVNLTANAAGETVQAISAGDFNNDGNPDIAVVTNRAAANTVSNGRIILLGGSPDPANGLQTVTYTSRGTQDDAAGEGVRADVASAVNGSDFTGDGIDDVAFSFPTTDVSGAGEEDGEVYVIYGDASTLPTVSLPAAGAFTARAVAPNGLTVAGTAAANNEFGMSMAVGNFNGANADLVVMARDAQDSLQFLPGGSNALQAATIQWNFQADGDSLSDDDALPGHLVMGRITNNASGFDDIVVGLPGEGAGGTIRIIPPGTDGTGGIAKVGILTVVNSRSAALDGEIGMAIALGDLNQDGSMDLIIGNSTTGTTLGDVYAEFGPISTNLTFSDTVNDFDIAFLGTQDTGSFVGFADVNGDGVSDLLMGDPATDLHCVLGLTRPTP